MCLAIVWRYVLSGVRILMLLIEQSGDATTLPIIMITCRCRQSSAIKVNKAAEIGLNRMAAYSSADVQGEAVGQQCGEADICGIRSL